MTIAIPDLPEPIREVRRALEVRRDARVVGEVVWDPRQSLWALPLEVTQEDDGGNGVPKTTRWFMLLEPSYPYGKIDIYPSKNGGIVGTYHHQDHNGAGDPNVPWRDGDICVRESGFTLGRVRGDPDPKDHPDRLLWYVDRLVEWVRRAANDTLVSAGDYFELPQFCGSGGTIGFIENADTFSVWSSAAARFGTAELVPFGTSYPYAVRCFKDATGRKLIAPDWGIHVTSSQDPKLAAWVMFEQMPMMPPYAAPMRWGEFYCVMKQQGLSPESILQPALKPLRHKNPGILLIGFRIPKRFGEPTSLVHWQPVSLGDLSSGSQPGFRNSERGHWKRDRSLQLADSKPISWLVGRNWDVDEISARGQLGPKLRSSRILLIGAGALGSAIAELMVRGSAYKIHILDDDLLDVGNLSRHTLTLVNVGKSKASGLASRLNLLSPHACVTWEKAECAARFNGKAEGVEQYDMIIDCTAEDDVARLLANRERSTPADYVSISCSWGARWGYVYRSHGRRFPLSHFAAELTSHIERDRTASGSEPLLWEGTGCWHPVFPAMATNIWTIAAAAVNELDRWRHAAERTDGLVVCCAAMDATNNE